MCRLMCRFQDKMMCPEMQEVRPEDVPEYRDEQHRFAVKVLVGQYKGMTTNFSVINGLIERLQHVLSSGSWRY